MKNILLVGLVVGLVSSVALAHTGPLVGGQPYEEEIEILSASYVASHDETVDNPNDVYKGWWWFSLTNSLDFAWDGVKIAAGAGDQVAIVEGSGLIDEWGFPGDSVAVTRPGSVSYAGSLGSRDYDDGFGGTVTGFLWQEATAMFNVPLPIGQKVGFKVYTDNSWYEGDPATVFSLTITPIPEPASLLLLSLGGLALIRRR